MNSEERAHIQQAYETAIYNSRNGWPNMSQAEIRSDLQAFQDHLAKENSLLPSEVSVVPMEDGLYGTQSNIDIHLNEAYLNDPDESFSTLIHESSHSSDWQAALFSEVRQHYTPEDLAERNTPIPDPNIDPMGYVNHPAEKAAEEAAQRGLTQIQQDREAVAEAYAQYKGNQILFTPEIVLDEPTGPSLGSFAADPTSQSPAHSAAAEPTQGGNMNQILMTPDDLTQENETQVDVLAEPDMTETLSIDPSCDLDLGPEEDEGEEP